MPISNPKDYIATNKKSWNDSVEHHVKSAFYDLAVFKNGKSSLHNIELNLLGDVSGKRILHLQCHFGQDTLSLARLGANVTGVDFSDKAIAFANKLKKELQLDAEFICSAVYDLPEHLHNQFDLVYTSYGVIGWLPDLNRWADAISKCLKPNGKLILVEFHPAVWMFDNNFTHVQYSYFNKKTITETETGTYAARDAHINWETITWNHSLSEVISSLLENDLVIEHFNEYDSSPYECFANLVEIAPEKFQIKNMKGKLPLLYSIVAIKS